MLPEKILPFPMQWLPLFNYHMHKPSCVIRSAHALRDILAGYPNGMRTASARSRPTSRTAAKTKRMTPARSRKAWYSSFSLIASFLCAQHASTRCLTQRHLANVASYPYTTASTCQAELCMQGVLEYHALDQFWH